MSFKSVARKISGKEHIALKDANAILANSSRHASEAAKKKNPALRKVLGR